jgi:hypothetical protein
MGPELIDSDHPSPRLTGCMMMDQHAITLEILADGGAGGIDSTRKALTFGILPAEETSLAVRIFPARLLKVVGYLIRKVGLNMNKKQFIGNPVPAIVIPRRELSFNFYELPKALAAFPAPVAVELGHISQLISATGGNKLCEIFRAKTSREYF